MKDGVLMIIHIYAKVSNSDNKICIGANMIQKKTTLKLTCVNDIDSLYKNIKESNQLTLSPKIKSTYLGGVSSIIQFLCSWQRYHKEVFIVLNSQVNICSDKLAKNEVLLVAFYLSKKVFLNDEDIRDELLKKFIPFVESMNSTSISNYLSEKGTMSGKGRELKFLFLHKVRNEFLKLFYNKDKQFKSKREIHGLLGDLLKTPISVIKKDEYDQDLDSIKEVIYEILNNTDKHARRDIKQVEIPKNIRGISLNFYDLNDKNRKSFIESQKEYKFFLEPITEILAISIFDSGEGMVKKYIETTSNEKEKDMSCENKQKILSKLFLPEITSSQIPNSGMGLSYVEENIKTLKGTLSIKTNTLEYFLMPNNNNEYKPTFKKCDSPCTGTSVVMLIPLKFKGKV